jgi:heat-inducible transcriptional repressor
VLTPRQELLLGKVIDGFNATGQPVGSKALAADPDVEYGPSTIRNELAVLEERGLLAHPHTSAGRVPTDKGYRLFVDQLTILKPLSLAERRAIRSLLEEAVDLDDVVDRTVRLLAQLTHQVAVVQYPSLRRSTLRHIELLPLTTRRLLVVIIMDNGRVEQRAVDSGEPLDHGVVAELRVRLNTVGAGYRMPQLGLVLADLPRLFAPEDRMLVEAVVEVVLETVAGEAEERVVLAGTANLARADIDFPRTIGPVLEALEEQVVLLRLLSEMAQDDSVTVRIGHENPYEVLSEASVVSAGYGGPGQGTVARLGVLGPTRMDYAGTMAAVRAVARYLSRFLAS